MTFTNKISSCSFQERVLAAINHIMRHNRMAPKYHVEVCKNTSGFSIDYGIIEGNNNILFIKVGQNGSIYGYDNKYLKIANNINKKYGYTVICASNPYDGKTNLLEFDMNFVSQYCNKFKNYNVYYMGVSNGATIGANWGYLYPQIINMLLINPPIFVNWHKIKYGLGLLKTASATIIIGEADPSFKFAGMINLVNNDKLQLVTLKNIDHNFSDKLSEFIALPEQYLFKSKN